MCMQEMSPRVDWSESFDLGWVFLRPVIQLHDYRPLLKCIIFGIAWLEQSMYPQ